MQVVFCPNKQHSFKPFMCLGLIQKKVILTRKKKEKYIFPSSVRVDLVFFLSLSVGLVALNCTYTSYVTKLQSFFTLAKVAAMVIIIIAAFTTVPSGTW